MNIEFVLTRPTLINITSGILHFLNEQEYEEWIKNNFDKFQICYSLQSKVLTLINY